MSAERNTAVSQGLRHSGRLHLWLNILLVTYICALGFGAAPARAQPEYLLAPGDILKISVFKNPDLSLDVRVSESGSIGYPLIGSVPVKGLTLPAAESKIAQMLRDGGFVVNPQVNILLTSGFGNLVSVIGEVNKSGRYSVDAAGGHISGMLAAAGANIIYRELDDLSHCYPDEINAALLAWLRGMAR